MNQQIPESELILNGDGSVYHLHLKPENLASLIFTVGDPDRVGLVSRYFDQVDFKTSKREFVTHTGRINGKRVTVISTGMGTDNIEILMTELDALVNVDLIKRCIKPVHHALDIIRLGTSGSMQQDIAVGSLLVSEYAIGLDTLMQFYPALSGSQTIGTAVQEALGIQFQPYQAKANKELLGKLGQEVQRGVTLTCPGFYGPQGRKVRLEPKINQVIERLSQLAIAGYRLTNFEMETAGYYAMGNLLGHRMLSLNAIVANRITGQFDTDAEHTIDRMIQLALNTYS